MEVCLGRSGGNRDRARGAGRGARDAPRLWSGGARRRHVGLDSSALIRNRIEHNTFYGMRYGAVTATTFERNVLSGNGEFGIALEDGSVGNLLKRNAISKTDGRGIFMSEDSSANALYRNRSDRNTDDGFAVMGPEATLVRNGAARNGALGFDVPAGAALASRNEARHNGDSRQCVGIPCRSGAVAFPDTVRKSHRGSGTKRGRRSTRRRPVPAAA